VAYDGGSPPRSGVVEVKVTVTDANDNGPVFEYSSYEVTVAENIDLGSNVAKVTAFDADAGINAEVSYLRASKQRCCFRFNTCIVYLCFSVFAGSRRQNL